MLSILNRLKEYLEETKPKSLPSIEMIDRMIERVETEGINEQDLLIEALKMFEKFEGEMQYNALEYQTRDRRKLKQYLAAPLQKARAKRDPREIGELLRLQRLLDEPPETTRRMNQETIDLALEVLKIKEEHPNWSYKNIALRHFGDIGEEDRIKKAVQRLRRRIKEESEDG